MARLLAFAVGLLLLFAIIGLTAPDRNQTLETARYLDGHADALNYEARILEMQYQRAAEQARQRHLTLRMAIGLGALVGVTWAGAWAVTRQRRPQAQPPLYRLPPYVLDQRDLRRIEAAEWESQWER